MAIYNVPLPLLLLEYVQTPHGMSFLQISIPSTSVPVNDVHYSSKPYLFSKIYKDLFISNKDMFSLEKGVSPTLMTTRILPIPLILLTIMPSGLELFSMMSEYSDGEKLCESAQEIVIIGSYL